jgi:outer membrane lipopolysaccharide assembly protein LptE/RlpB
MLCLSACGYRFAGDESLPGGVRKICIPLFENRTGEIGLETGFADDLMNQFRRNSSVVLTGRESADAVLVGKIESLNTDTVSRRGAHSAFERQVRISAGFELKSIDGKVIWSVKGISSSESYPVVSDTLATEQFRQNAIAKISKKIAELAYQYFASDF